MEKKTRTTKAKATVDQIGRGAYTVTIKKEIVFTGNILEAQAYINLYENGNIKP